MVFQAQLGTLWDKSTRIAKLAVALSPITGANPADAEKAALLAKCDLTSELVGEFQNFKVLRVLTTHVLKVKTLKFQKL